MLRKLKILLLRILGAPLLLLAPFITRSVKKLEDQIENDPDSVPEHIRKYHLFTKMDDEAYKELKAGNYDKAKSIAKKLLIVSKDFEDDWNYGNAIHHSNTILGLLSLKENNTPKAINYLKKSTKNSGSPQLDSFGPNICLAMELLLLGKDNEVIEYLDAVEAFWDLGYKVLPKWKKDIISGVIQKNWERLKY